MISTEPGIPAQERETREGDEARAIYAAVTHVAHAACSWSGFNLIGDKKSVTELRRLMHQDSVVESLRKTLIDERAARSAPSPAAEDAGSRVLVERNEQLEWSRPLTETTLLNEAFNALGNLLFDKPGQHDLDLHTRIGKFLHAQAEAQRPVREEVIRLMREDFDPPRPNSELPHGEWDDNAEDVADKIVALFSVREPPAEDAATDAALDDAIEAWFGRPNIETKDGDDQKVFRVRMRDAIAAYHAALKAPRLSESKGRG